MWIDSKRRILSAFLRFLKKNPDDDDVLNIFFTRTRASTKTRLLLLEEEEEEEEEEDNEGVVVVVPRLLARGMRSIDSMEVVVVYARACFSLYSVTLVF